MSSTAVKAWSQGTSFVAAVSIDQQASIATILLVIAAVLSGLFSLQDKKGVAGLIKQVLLAIPASLSLGFGFVYLLCAVGVYV
ncbi:uncharacterized protein V1516DRAFT_682517 [Lipomyces oligophaga]|uniref:uncharacterized protein n=1 Tax=Lipomyces oligophaga TaxID=45792 RepID=UPI0034CD39D4